MLLKVSLSPLYLKNKKKATAFVEQSDRQKLQLPHYKPTPSKSIVNFSTFCLLHIASFVSTWCKSCYTHEKTPPTKNTPNEVRLHAGPLSNSISSYSNLCNSHFYWTLALPPRSSKTSLDFKRLWTPAAKNTQKCYTATAMNAVPWRSLIK